MINKYSKRIFLITDGESEVKEADQLDPIIDQLIKTDTSVNIISIDFWNHLNEESENEEEFSLSDKSEGEGDDNDDKPHKGMQI